MFGKSLLLNSKTNSMSDFGKNSEWKIIFAGVIFSLEFNMYRPIMLSIFDSFSGFKEFYLSRFEDSYFCRYYILLATPIKTSRITTTWLGISLKISSKKVNSNKGFVFQVHLFIYY